MAELYDALQKSFMDPVMGMGIGLMAGQNMGQGLQQGLGNSMALQAQQFRQQQAMDEMLRRAEYLRLANEEAQQKRAAAQAKQQERQQNMQTYGMYDPTARALETSTMTDAQGMPLRPGMPGWNEQMERGPGVVVNTAPQPMVIPPPPEPGEAQLNPKTGMYTKYPEDSADIRKTRAMVDFVKTQHDELTAMENDATNPISGVGAAAAAYSPEWIKPANRQKYELLQKSTTDRLNSYWSGAEVPEKERILRTEMITVLPTDKPKTVFEKQRLRIKYMNEMRSAIGEEPYADITPAGDAATTQDGWTVERID